MTNILHITKSINDATGKVALQFHRNLKRAGHRSFILLETLCEDGRVEGMAGFPKGVLYFLNRYEKKAKQFFGINTKIKSNPDFHFYNQNERTTRYNSREILRKVPFRPDAVILYWISGIINSKNIYEISKTYSCPIIWYLMDMGPLTGGCHYAWDCKRYSDSCGTCPAIFSDSQNDISRANMLQKKKYLNQIDIRIVVGTEWLFRQAKESALWGTRPICKIPVSQDPDIFKPSDKTAAKSYFGLKSDEKVIFLGATNFSHKRKGMEYLIQAMVHLKAMSPVNYKVKLLVAGHCEKIFLEKLPFDYVAPGVLNKQALIKAYQAADVFVCTSVEDSGPTMINDAVMSGTPVVCFEMGVALDLVHSGLTGYRAKLRDSEDIARGMMDVLNLDAGEYSRMCNNCRELGLKLCAPSVQMEGFRRLLSPDGY
jgi:glycosyltransferase involved in cell wall biosynthesis